MTSILSLVVLLVCLAVVVAAPWGHGGHHGKKSVHLPVKSHVAVPVHHKGCGKGCHGGQGGWGGFGHGGHHGGHGKKSVHLPVRQSVAVPIAHNKCGGKGCHGKK